MHLHYADLLEGRPKPKWFDQRGVPRWCDFHPREVTIYGDEVALLRMRCQDCGRHFDVCVSYETLDLLGGHPKIETCIKGGSVGYGDPPNMECCPAGPTMTSVDERVLQYWRRSSFEWTRVPELEVDLPQDDGA